MVSEVEHGRSVVIFISVPVGVLLDVHTMDHVDFQGSAMVDHLVAIMAWKET
jgi:hypothetical protein